MIQDQYEVKVRGRLGPGRNDDKSMTILNRCLEWKEDVIHYEADPQHAAILIKELGVQKSKPAVTPGKKMPTLSDEQNPYLNPPDSTKFRSLTARCNFIAQDRPDVQYVVKEIARGIPACRTWTNWSGWAKIWSEDQSM